MKYSIVCIFESITNVLYKINWGVCFVAAFILYAPIALIIDIYDWCEEKYKNYTFRHKYSDLYNEKLKHEEWLKKAENRELDLSKLPHNREKYRLQRFQGTEHYFFEKRERKLPYTTIVYVENEYNDRMHKFFEERQDLIQKWTDWHGYNIEFLDKETIKEDMFFPQEYDEMFHHGFLRFTHSSSCDPEYGIFGDIHCYYEINPTSDEDIIHQMNLIMEDIYENIKAWLV